MEIRSLSKKSHNACKKLPKNRKVNFHKSDEKLPKKSPIWAKKWSPQALGKKVVHMAINSTILSHCTEFRVHQGRRIRTLKIGRLWNRYSYLLRDMFN